MKNSLTSKEYWEKREAYKLKKGLKDLKKIEKELVDEYKKTMNEIGKEISNLFYKYANDNNLSFSDAKKYLNSSEFKAFRMDLKSYMKLIEETGDEELLLELNTLSTKSRISRLEEMFYQCDKYINEVYKGTNKKLAEVYNGTIKDAYYQTIFDTHKAIGVATSFSYIDNDMIKEILAFPWSGRHYSERLWSNRTKLKNAMVEELTQMLIQGKGVKEVSKALSKRLDADFKNCLRLIHTEHSYFMGEATYKAYEELEVEEYQFVATLDKRTSDICQELDGKVFNMKDRVVGVNASPMHPRCRSCEIPYIQDEYSTRFARDEKGKGIEVPSNMTYKEWKEAIDNNNLEETIKIKEKANKKGNKETFKKDRIVGKEYNVSFNNGYYAGYKGFDVDDIPAPINRADYRHLDNGREIYKAKRKEREDVLEKIKEEGIERAINRPRKYNNIEKATSKLKELGFKEVHLDNVDPLLYDDIITSYEYSLSKIPKLKDSMHYLGDNTGLEKLYNNKEFKEISIKNIMETTGKNETQAKRYYSTIIKKDLLSTINEEYLSAHYGMMMNNKRFKNYKNVLSGHFDNLADNFLFKSDGTIQSVFTHEIGHNVDRMLRIEYGVNFDDFLTANSKILETELSEYGTLNSLEAFAELYSNYIHCPQEKQNTLTKNFGKWLEEKLKEVE